MPYNPDFDEDLGDLGADIIQDILHQQEMAPPGSSHAVVAVELASVVPGEEEEELLPDRLAPAADTGDDDGGNEDEDDDEGGDEDIAPAASLATAKSKARKPRSSRAKGATPATGSRKRKTQATADVTTAKRSARPARMAAQRAPIATNGAIKKRGRPARSEPTNGTKAPAKRGRKTGASSRAVPADEYEVEEILESAIDGDTMEHMYHVKWKGYPLNEATWEPRTNLEHAAELVRKFDASKKRRRDVTKDNGEEKVKKAPGRKPRAKA